MATRYPIIQNDVLGNQDRGYGTLSDGTGGVSATMEANQHEPEHKALYAVDVDRKSVERSRKLLCFAAFITLLFAVGTLAGGVYSYSLALIINATSYLSIFARLVFVGYLLQCAGRPASRLAHYRQYKPELRISMMSMLVAWLLLGGGIFLAVRHLTKQDFGIKSPLVFMITAGVGCAFAIILLCMVQVGQQSTSTAMASGLRMPDHRDDDAWAARKKNVGGPGPITENMPEFNRERGLLLRRTLKHIPMRPYMLLTAWFALQCIATFAIALLFWFMPGKWPWADLLAAFCFMPLSFVSAATLLYDVINLLTEGLLQGIDFSEMAESLLSIDGVTGVRHLRIWALTMDRVSLSVLLTVQRDANVESVLNRASALLKAKYDIFEYNVDTERSDAALPIRGGGLSPHRAMRPYDRPY